MFSDRVGEPAELETSTSKTIIAAGLLAVAMSYGGCVRADFGLAGFLLTGFSLRT